VLKNKKKPAYYFVRVTRDGTVLYARETAKPRKSRFMGTPKIDEDGVYIEYLPKEDDFPKLSDWAKGSYQTVVAVRLNDRRVLREMVLPRLAAIEAKLDGLAQKLESLGRLSG